MLKGATRAIYEGCCDDEQFPNGLHIPGETLARSSALVSEDEKEGEEKEEGDRMGPSCACVAVRGSGRNETCDWLGEAAFIYNIRVAIRRILQPLRIPSETLARYSYA